MAKQQSKRRRKRYEPGSAYAGHVKPTGVLGFISSARMVRLVFISMALALAAGGGVAIFGSNVLFRSSPHSGNSSGGFVVPDDGEFLATPQPGSTVEVRQYASPPVLTIDQEKRYVATIKTELGDIEVELLVAQAPETVNNFVFLAQDGFYDGLVFHYGDGIFSANAGDPACTVGSSSCRGDGGPGYELTEDASGDFERGVLGMSNASQFFIALTESEQFEGFTPFGRIVSGLEVAEQVMAGTGIQTIEIFEQ